MIRTTTKEWTFVGAQTDLAIVTCGAAERATVVYGQVTCSNANTGDVNLRVGFAAATLPATTDDTGTGAAGIFMSHPGIAPGGGMVVSNGGAPVAVGAVGEDIRVTTSACVFTRLVLTYWIDDLTDPA